MGKKFAIGYGKIIIPIMGVIVMGIFLFLFHNEKEEEFQLVPTERPVKAGGKVSGTEAGTGWSVEEDPEEAVKEAVEMALAGKRDKTPDFAIIFATSGSNVKTMLCKARELFGDETKIYGGTSDPKAVMTDKGFVHAAKSGYAHTLMKEKRGLAIMTVTSKDVVFGVGSADLSGYPSIQKASKAAILNAIKSAGKLENDRPKIILITITAGIEEEVIEGIEELVGKDTPILGGTAAGPIFAVFGQNKVHSQGVSLAVIYTDLPLGWTFEGGFDVRDPHTGIVTKVEGQAIAEIDNRAALDVYDEWLGGKIGKLYKKMEDPIQ